MSESEKLDRRAATGVCRDLRSKRWFFLERAPRSNEELVDGSCALWCGRTGLAVGPHNAVVDAELCTPARACFRSHARPT